MNDDIRRLLWNAANSLRIHVDAATYKHRVLGPMSFNQGAAERVSPQINQEDTEKRFQDGP